MTKVLYVRIDASRHRALAAATATLGMTLSQLVLQLLDQWSFQTDPNFKPPPWLIEALAAGLPIYKCGDHDNGESDETAVDNVVRFAGHR